MLKTLAIATIVTFGTMSAAMAYGRCGPGYYWSYHYHVCRAHAAYYYAPNPVGAAVGGAGYVAGTAVNAAGNVAGAAVGTAGAIVNSVLPH